MPTSAGHVKHLPRAEKLPLTGYELLAAQLSSHSSHVMKHRRDNMAGPASAQSTWSTGTGGSDSSVGSVGSVGSAGSDGSYGSATALPTPTIKPLYRRFEALNHRILLHLQDELSELEEQLHRLDTADTQTRRLQNSILPASRRAEALAGGELQWHKTDVLGKIGYKLGQYNHVLSSFTETQHLASPSLSDIRDYRTYLDTQQPIAEIETRFLDATGDLVTLARPSSTQSLAPSSGTCSPAPSASSLGGSYFSSLETGAVHGSGQQQHCLGNHLHSSGSSTGNSSPPSPTPSSLSESSSTASSKSVDDNKDTEGKPKVDSPTLPYEASASFVSRDKAIAVPIGTPAPENNVLHLVVAVAVAVLVPILAFTMISGRMAIVCLVAFAVFGAQVQASTVRVGALAQIQIQTKIRAAAGTCCTVQQSTVLP